MTGTGVGSAVYSYDGDGRRVKKVWTPYGGSAQTTYFFYNALGQLSLEYSADVPVSTETTYPFADMLGSVREVTDENGSVVESYDYLPFGRMLSTYDNNRGGYHPQNPDTYIASSMPQKFTGKERDETGLDYFGARYFSGALGRFTSADAPFADQHTNNPQSWNLFIYALNNPLRFVDMDGFAVIESEKTEYFKIEGAKTAAQAAIQANNYYQGGPQYSFTMQVINMNPSNAKITVKDGSFKAESSLISADVKLDITIKLPEWHSDDPAEQAIFDDNLEVIKSHERDHVEGARAEAKALDESLPGTPGEGEGATGQEAARNAANDMRNNVSEKQHNAVKKINKRDEELDDKTKHGTVPLPRNY